MRLPDTLHFEAILKQSVPTDWRYQGPLVFEFNDQSIVGTESSYLEIADGEGFGELKVSGPAGIPFERGVTGRVRVDGKLDIIADHAFCHLRSTSGLEHSFDINLNLLKVSCPIEGPAATRETILGMVLGRRSGYNLATAFNTQMFGRKAVIAGYASTDPLATVDSVQVVYEGSPITDDERAALFDLLRFLSGSRGNSAFLETFGQTSNRLEWHYENHGRPSTVYTYHPIDLATPTGDVATAASEFPIMLERMLKVRNKKPAAIAATLHHYNDAAKQRFPTSQLRDLAVAFGALRSAVDDEPQIEQEDATVALARRSGLHISEQEADVIQTYRHDILTRGFHGDESQRDQFRMNQDTAELFFNIFHQLVLKLLGWTGRCYDARLLESQELGSRTRYQRLTLEERIQAIIEGVGQPPGIENVDIQLGQNQDEEPIASIVFQVRDDSSPETVQKLQRFSQRLQSQILMEQDLPWPQIRFVTA